jgi:hypothetical protein
VEEERSTAQEPATETTETSDQPAEEGEINEEAIARRAYEISLGEDAGTPEENWARAEREVRGG